MPVSYTHLVDLLIGLIAGALLKLAVYVKGKNRKKFRQGEEYGSARWGKPEDIKPYMDPELDVYKRQELEGLSYEPATSL